MHLFRRSFLGCLAFLPVVHAGEITEPVCEEQTVLVEQIAEGFVCDERTPEARPSAGDLARTGRRDAGTRFSLDRTADTNGSRLSPEQLRELEAASRSFRRPEAIDPLETVIRVYDAGGAGYEERKVRFGALPREFLFDAQRRSRETFVPGEALDAAIGSDLPSVGLDPRSFFPIELAPTLPVSGPCQ